MARFTIDDIDYAQNGSGTPHAIPELRAQLPVSADAVRQIAASDRDDYYIGVLESPVKYHSGPDFDWSRPQPQLTGTDDDGRFVSVLAVVIVALMAGSQVHAGMRGFPVQLAYIVDNTVSEDTELQFAKCDLIGWAMISDATPAADT